MFFHEVYQTYLIKQQGTTRSVSFTEINLINLKWKMNECMKQMLRTVRLHHITLNCTEFLILYIVLIVLICICKNVSSLKHIGAPVSRGISDSYKRTDAHPNPVPYMLPSKMLMVQPCKQIFHRNHD